MDVIELLKDQRDPTAANSFLFPAGQSIDTLFAAMGIPGTPCFNSCQSRHAIRAVIDMLKKDGGCRVTCHELADIASGIRDAHPDSMLSLLKVLRKHAVEAREQKLTTRPIIVREQPKLAINAPQGTSICAETIDLIQHVPLPITATAQLAARTVAEQQRIVATCDAFIWYAATKPIDLLVPVKTATRLPDTAVRSIAEYAATNPAVDPTIFWWHGIGRIGESKLRRLETFLAKGDWSENAMRAVQPKPNRTDERSGLSVYLLSQLATAIAVHGPLILELDFGRVAGKMGGVQRMRFACKPQTTPGNVAALMSTFSTVDRVAAQAPKDSDLCNGCGNSTTQQCSACTLKFRCCSKACLVRTRAAHKADCKAHSKPVK